MACTWSVVLYHTLMLYSYLYHYLHTDVFCNGKSDKRDLAKYNKEFCKTQL